MSNGGTAQVTLVRLRETYGESPFLHIYRRIFIATNGFNKEGEVDLTRRDIGALLECLIGENDISIYEAIVEGLAFLFPCNPDDDLLPIFERSTGLAIKISCSNGKGRIVLERRKN